MTRRHGYGTGRKVLQLAVAGAVVAGTPLAIAGTANAADGNTWDRIAQCESGGNWGIHTGNGLAGGLQFTPNTWKAFGGSGAPQNASRSAQIAVAERVLAAQGWGAWPSCSKKVGASGRAQPTKSGATSAPAARPKPVAAPTKPAVPVVPVVKNGADYTVVTGDSLARIAVAEHVPGGWKTIWDRNTDVLTNPNLLKVGQQLDLV